MADNNETAAQQGRWHVMRYPQPDNVPPWWHKIWCDDDPAQFYIVLGTGAATRLVAHLAQVEGERDEARREVADAINGNWVCEEHPGRPWPHDDCAGPGMPSPLLLEKMRAGAAEAQVKALTEERDALVYGGPPPTVQRLREAESKVKALEPLALMVPHLRADLAQSYERSHGLMHNHFTEDGQFIEFKDCSLWVCKNRREKLAEWDSVIEAARYDALSKERSDG